MVPLDQADWKLVPLRYRTQLTEYLMYGRPPVSDGLIAVLTNDLNRTIDNLSTPEIADLVIFLRRHVPLAAWGSGEKIALWEQVGGLEGEAVQ